MLLVYSHSFSFVNNFFSCLWLFMVCVCVSSRCGHWLQRSVPFGIFIFNGFQFKQLTLANFKLLYVLARDANYFMTSTMCYDFDAVKLWRVFLNNIFLMVNKCELWMHFGYAFTDVTYSTYTKSTVIHWISTFDILQFGADQLRDLFGSGIIKVCIMQASLSKKLFLTENSPG